VVITAAVSRFHFDIDRSASGPTPIDSWFIMIRKLRDGRYRLYSRKKNPKTGRRRT